ncbi:MAG TPA: alpha/beta fold hydrolase [Candidatus Acidoferrales bacterium]|nr:alpha/beta fold hydrolase [Candidatus Acidoferrales bacterium]
MLRWRFTRPLVLSLLALACWGQDEPQPLEANWVARDFTFGTGETLPELRLHYITLGSPQRDAAGRIRNAVLILHDTGSGAPPFLTGGFLGALFLKGQPLDASKYYIILPDAIGHGETSKPSDGLHAKFPHYNDGDMVRAQYLLVHDGLKVEHLRLVMGIGMGGMQTWLWGERYPDFMDALMPLASSPAQIAGRHRIFRDLVVDAIRTDPGWKDGEYTSPPRGLLTAQFAQFLMTTSPGQLQRLMPTSDVADAQFQTLKRRFLRAVDANDMLYQYDSSRNYDAGTDLEKIRAPLYAVNSADDELNPPELGILERAIQRVAKGRYIRIPASDETRGHATAMRARVWRDYLSELLRAAQ